MENNQMLSSTDNPKDEIDLRDIFYLYLSYWKTFIASVLTAIALAVIYLVITPPVYTRTASIMIKDNNKGNPAATGGSDFFSDISLFQSQSNIKDEIQVLKTNLLMEEVIRRLHLDKSYTCKQYGLRNHNLYKTSPIEVELDSLATDNTAFSFTIRLLENNQIKLDNFVHEEDKYNQSIDAKFGDIIQTPCGAIRITPTDFYSDEERPDKVKFIKHNITTLAPNVNTQLSISLAEKDVNVVNISANDVSATRASDIINMLITVYNESWMADKNIISASTSNFISDRLLVIEQELGNVDKELFNYKSSNLIPDVQAVSKIVLEQSKENISQQQALESQLATSKYVKNYMNEGANRNQLLPANSGIKNLTIEKLIDEFNALKLQRDSKVANSSENNPLVRDLDRSLNQLKQTILRSIDDYIATINIQIKSVGEMEKKTNWRLATGTTQEKELLPVERQQKIKEALYLFLLQKREENELTQAFSAYNTRVIQPPHGSTFPTAPRRAIIMLAAFAIGLVVPAGGILLKKSFKTTIETHMDLEELSIPFLGEIPLYKRKKEKEIKVTKGKKKGEKSAEEIQKETILINERSRNHINEAFRIIRTNLDFMSSTATNGNVIMTSSMHVNSGKTFTVSNLATSMAIRDNRVLIIDLDIRKGTLSKMINSPSKGITDYLNQTVNNYTDIIFKEAFHRNLDIIPVGTIPPNPTELLMKNQLGVLISHLRKQYDIIMLDCPPINIVADADIVARHADRTLFIIRAGLFDKRLLPILENAYKTNRFPNLAYILNGVSQEKKGYGYGHEYGYGYHSEDEI